MTLVVSCVAVTSSFVFHLVSSSLQMTSLTSDEKEEEYGFLRIKYSEFRSILINYSNERMICQVQMLFCKYAYQFYSQSLRATRLL